MLRAITLKLENRFQYESFVLLTGSAKCICSSLLYFACICFRLPHVTGQFPCKDKKIANGQSSLKIVLVEIIVI